jgi:class 3 adenylate cyclase
VRIERTAPRTDALTAARAASLPQFRELFPAETLAPGQLVSVAQVTLLITELENADALYRELGDAPAFACIHEHFQALEQIVRGEGGAVVKTVQAGLIASFHDAVSAVRAALAMAPALAAAEHTSRLALHCGVHRGPALTATINDRLDFFGATVTAALHLPRCAPAGSVALSRPVANDVAVAEYLNANHFDPELVNVTDDNLPEPVVYVIETNRNS